MHGCTITSLTRFKYSIHPSFFCFLCKAGLQWQQAKQGSSNVLSKVFQLFPGDPKAFQSQMRYINSLACPGSTLGSPTL